MKKILTHLTGIVFLIAVLAAGACKQNSKPKEAEEAENEPKAAMAAIDTTKIDIYLNAISIDGSMHLEMSDSKNPDWYVIDGLMTVVYPGYTVTWRKALHSNIDEVLDIRPVKVDTNIFRNGVTETVLRSLWTLEIPDSAITDTVKYEIDFIVKEDKDTIYTIDPYLKLPDDR